MDTETEMPSSESDTTSKPNQTEKFELSDKQFASWWVEYLHQKGLSYKQIKSVCRKAERIAKEKIIHERRQLRKSNDSTLRPETGVGEQGRVPIRDSNAQPEHDSTDGED